MRLLLFILGTIGCLQSCLGPARADDVPKILRERCGERGSALIGPVRSEARRWLLHPDLLARVVGHESRCDPAADSGVGDLGLGQIRLGTDAARGASRAELMRPGLNLYLTARHLAWCLILCGERIPGALSVYSGRRWCRASAYSWRVMR